MEDRLLAILQRFSPRLETESELDRASVALDLFVMLYATPLVIVGFVWLAASTDLNLIRSEWPTLLLLSAFLFLFRQLHFFFFIEVPGAHTPQFDSTFEPLVTWSAVLIFGPASLWMAVLLDLAFYLQQWQRADSTQRRWEAIRNLVQNLAGITPVTLVALSLYQRLGGAFPLPALTLDVVLPAFYATLVYVLLQLLLYAPVVIYFRAGGSRVFARGSGWLAALVWGLAIMMGANALMTPFAILAAGLYTQNGLGVYAFFLVGLLLVSWLAHRLSMVVERSQQRSRELAKLEQLGRAILNAPPDASTLPDLLEEYVSGMFSRSQIEIHLFPDRTLLHLPHNWPPLRTSVWEWLRANPEPRFFLPKTTLPWGGPMQQDAGVALTPILEVERTGGAPSTPIGGIYLWRRLDPLDVASLLPALQSLAAQIASTLRRAEVHKVEQELAVAGRIQASFLPDSLPPIPGWQLAATLRPARETSGDFYDVVPLPNGRWGLLVADVADKGTGAALFMALSRTLIRTYATEYDTQPERVLRAANRRILADARTDLFVTLFYGILDPLSGILTYCNAGHNPPYLLTPREGDALQALSRTGLPLGILEDEVWEPRGVQLAPGSVLLLYTDGVTEAQNPQGAFFSVERLLETVQAHRGASAQGFQEALLGALNDFVGDAALAPHDDITLMVLVRDDSTDL